MLSPFAEVSASAADADNALQVSHAMQARTETLTETGPGTRPEPLSEAIGRAWRIGAGDITALNATLDAEAQVA